MLEATRKIMAYTGSLSKAAFLEDEKTFDAVVRNLEIIGEAVKKLPEDLRTQHPALEWKKMAGLRDILIHEYFGLDADIVWDIVKNKVPPLDREVRAMLHQ
ncbi:MAG: HepT-like ribonuclease domain-containing protein [Nitrospiraceae bacterium]